MPIDGIFQTYLDVLKPVLAAAARRDRGEPPGARAGRRADGVFQPAGSILLSTGNKSELAVGYCTLYGDMCGGLAVISDVPKSLVYDLARYVNRKRRQSSLNPAHEAAERRAEAGSERQDSLPPYEILDPIVAAYVERDLDAAAIATLGFDPAVVADVIRRIDAANTSVARRRRHQDLVKGVRSRAEISDRGGISVLAMAWDSSPGA